MELNDYLGSFAQENVDFATKIIKTKAVGDNYWKTMVFVENDRFVDTSVQGWEPVPGVATAKALTVTADDYAQFTEGLLESWLYDLFVNGSTYDCILVAFASKEDVGDTDKAEAVATQLENAYAVMKPFAYFKTICACTGDAGAEVISAPLAVKMAQLCATDSKLLSSAPLLPYRTQTPENVDSDPLYAALTAAKTDAFLSHNPDVTSNAALYSLGLALSQRNASGLPLGNQFDMWASGSATSSGLSKQVRESLKSKSIQVWKPVGNNTGDVAAEGVKTLNGNYMPAQWIVCYVAYMTKVGIATLMTQPGFFFNQESYNACLTIMNDNLATADRTGRLEGLQSNPPGFANLPQGAAGEIVIDNAWSATYVDNVRKVAISGVLYIKE